MGERDVAGVGGEVDAVIVGASGYTGGVLAELLLAHPRVRLAGVFGSSRREEASVALSALHPCLRGRTSLRVRGGEAGSILGALAGSAGGVVFLATPHEASAALAPALLAGGCTVVDLSAAFRLGDASMYPAYYGFEHPAAGLLAGRPGGAVYGLAEHASAALRGARLIAVPGCYPTASLLALRPLAERGLVESGWRPIIDATSGVSGAGRVARQSAMFCEVSQGAYGVPAHRHGPEIDLHAGGAAPVVFTPHLGPYDRGIAATMHVRLAPGVGGAEVGAALREAYDGRGFVRLLGGIGEDEGASPPSVGGVRGTNCCDIAWHAPERGGHARLFSAIDNLVKGASGQAVQCLNLAMGWDERLGLPGASPGGVTAEGVG